MANWDEDEDVVVFTEYAFLSFAWIDEDKEWDVDTVCFMFVSV